MLTRDESSQDACEHLSTAVPNYFVTSQQEVIASFAYDQFQGSRAESTASNLAESLQDGSSSCLVNIIPPFDTLHDQHFLDTAVLINTADTVASVLQCRFEQEASSAIDCSSTAHQDVFASWGATFQVSSVAIDGHEGGNGSRSHRAGPLLASAPHEQHRPPGESGWGGGGDEGDGAGAGWLHSNHGAAAPAGAGADPPRIETEAGADGAPAKLE